MAFGCENCGHTTRRRSIASDGQSPRCPECGSSMVTMTLGAALRLAREREEARRWRALAGFAAGDVPERPTTAT
jgi:DNA-directed RNA polymerase subunit RPC12/RpoP